MKALQMRAIQRDKSNRAWQENGNDRPTLRRERYVVAATYRAVISAATAAVSDSRPGAVRSADGSE